MGDSPQTAMGYGFKVNNDAAFREGNEGVWEYTRSRLEKAGTPLEYTPADYYRDEYSEYIDGYLDLFNLRTAYTGYHSAHNAFDGECETYIFAEGSGGANFNNKDVITQEAVENLTKVWELFEQKGKPTFDWYVVSYVG